MTDKQAQVSSRKQRVLVIDNDPDNMAIALEPLKWEGFEAQGISSARHAPSIIEGWQPQIVILAWDPSNKGCLRNLRRLRERYIAISLICLSDNPSTDSIIEALDNGADDYIVKPFFPLEFLARLRTHMRIRFLHEQLVGANERLKELVDIDDLTGLYNMRSLYQRLDFELERAKRFGRDVSVVMTDMDNFKEVNDGHDHLFGSFVISEVGKLIKQVTRNIDIPARYGGDEFLIVLTETSQEGAHQFCERLREGIEKHLFKSGDDEIKLTMSVGYASSRPGEFISSKTLVKRADHALYLAKDLGRNQTCAWIPHSDGIQIGKELPLQKKKAG